MSLLHKLQWRYATKKFNTAKNVAEEEVTELLKAMNLSASSFGLQPFKFVVVKNKELQETLMRASYNQEQIKDASHVIVIAARKNTDEQHIKEYIQRIAELRGQDIKELEEYQQSMIRTLDSLDLNAKLAWAQKQCYIVLGTLLLAAADLKIDACPMEGFNPEAYNEILALDKIGVHATVVVPIGYRSLDDVTQHAKKTRQRLDDIVELRY